MEILETLVASDAEFVLARCRQARTIELAGELGQRIDQNGNKNNNHWWCEDSRTTSVSRMLSFYSQHQLHRKSQSLTDCAAHTQQPLLLGQAR